MSAAMIGANGNGTCHTVVSLTIENALMPASAMGMSEIWPT